MICYIFHFSNNKFTKSVFCSSVTVSESQLLTAYFISLSVISLENILNDVIYNSFRSCVSVVFVKTSNAFDIYATFSQLKHLFSIWRFVAWKVCIIIGTISLSYLNYFGLILDKVLAFISSWFSCAKELVVVDVSGEDDSSYFDEIVLTTHNGVLLYYVGGECVVYCYYVCSIIFIQLECKNDNFIFISIL